VEYKHEIYRPTRELNPDRLSQSVRTVSQSPEPPKQAANCRPRVKPWHTDAWRAEC